MNNDICVFCGKPATKLCDFPMGYVGIIFDLPKNEKVFDYKGRDITAEQLVTCSRPMCEACSTEWEGMDFCPHCIEKTFKEILLIHEAKKSEQRNFLKMHRNKK